MESAEYRRLWIPGFADMAKPKDTLKWTEVEETAFGQIEQAFLSAPALALPDINKPFPPGVSVNDHSCPYMTDKVTLTTGKRITTVTKEEGVYRTWGPSSILHCPKVHWFLPSEIVSTVLASWRPT